ncbi:GH3 domain-containing protein-like [Montipora capricornis]|uniref:GH3 domain-containing protein-like n=1 Tax=Montipora capricornis TaxID=246305 RepID=UPI0035F1E900
MATKRYLGIGFAVGGVSVLGVALHIRRKRRSELHTFGSMLRQYFEFIILKVFGAQMMKKLESESINFEGVQERTLLSILKSNADTEYGMQYMFRDIQSKEQFVVKHPLTRYSHYKDYVDKVMTGEKNILTTKNPHQIGVTSGTSGKSSLIPTTADVNRTFVTRGVFVIMNTMFDAYPGTYQLQKTLKFFYSPKWRYTDSGLPIGPTSSTPSNSQRVLHLYTTPKAGFEILSEPEALYVYLLFALKDKNLGILEANFAQLVHTGLVALEAQWKTLVDDIKLGRINPDLEIAVDVRRKLESLLKPDKKRADELKTEFEKGFNGIVRRIWPHINLVLTCTTGSSELYASKLKAKYLSDVPMYSPIYAATEGLIGINLWPKDDHTFYILVPSAMFFEFIPLEESSKEQPSTVFPENAEVGKLYELVVTNLSGLYRYRIGDVVKIVRFHNNCPVIEYQYRQGQILNVRAEKTSERVLYDALTSVLSDLGQRFRLVDYTCAESIMFDEESRLFGDDEKSVAPFYVVFLELSEGGLEEEERKEIQTKLDNALCEISYVYESFRRKGSISGLQLFTVKEGTFRELRAHLLRVNPAATNQIKIPRVVKSKEALNVLLKYI